MTLDAHVVVRRPAHTVDMGVTAAPGDVVAVVGPNGSGKTTLLRALAGLQPLTEGHVTVAGEVWDGPGVRRTVPERRVGMVLQDILLFPHLTVLDNAAFGPRSRGASRSAARDAAQAWLTRVGVGDLAGRRPSEISGGQAQRVALARALATDPVLLLLDEPLAALDVGVAMALRIELARHLADFGGISLLVTHDALDALTIANRVLVVEDGHIVQEGPPSEVARRPRTEHVARLVGLNVVRGVSRGTVVGLGAHGELVTTTAYDGEVHAAFSPSAVTLTAHPPDGSARNVWPGRVDSLVPHGAAVRVHLSAAGGLIADVTPESAGRLGLSQGREVWASVKATEVRVYAAGDP